MTDRERLLDELRPVAFAIAYRMLGSVSEAEDVMQEALLRVHQALQAAREAIKGDTFLIEIRDLAYEIARNVELLLEDVRNAIQYRMAREAEEQARLGKEALSASHRLNILAALFFPLTAIASLFGMNLAHGLDEKSPVMFWLIFVAGAGMGFAMKGWVLAKPPARNRTRPPRRSRDSRIAVTDPMNGSARRSTGPTGPRSRRARPRRKR